MYKDIFTQAGLTENEAIIYEYLLNSGQSTAGEIIKNTPIKLNYTNTNTNNTQYTNTHNIHNIQIYTIYTIYKYTSYTKLHSLFNYFA